MKHRNNKLLSTNLLYHFFIFKSIINYYRKVEDNANMSEKPGHLVKKSDLTLKPLKQEPQPINRVRNENSPEVIKCYLQNLME